MTAEIIQIRDFQNKKDIERLRQSLEKEAADIIQALTPGAGIDAIPYRAPEKEPV